MSRSLLRMFLCKKYQIFSVLITLLTFLGICMIIWWSFAGASIWWDGNVSRNANVYVSETLKPLISSHKFCAEEKLLVVAINSRPDAYDARLAIRETWGQKHPNVSFFFLVGEIPDDYIQRSLQAESQEFGDIIQERFMDTYYNLTLKSINMLKLFKFHCTKARYLMKVDDDLFLNVPQIVKTLSKRTNHKNVLFGRIRSNIAPYRRKSSKWYMPYELYPDEKYPPFLCGPGYLMSADVVEELYGCSLEVPLIHFEDVFLTGICAERMKIKLTNSNSFTCDLLSRNICHYKDLYTIHYCTPHAIREFYDVLNSDSCEHYRDFNVVLQWVFFLNAP